MDPNEALAMLRAWVLAVHEYGSDESSEIGAAQAFEGLDEWLTNGGFKPADWA